MANEAYKLKADATFPRAIRKVDELIDGQSLYQTEGRTYNAGDYVLAEELSPPVRERAENGDLDHLLESASRDDALASRELQGLVYVPEHEAEAVVLESAGAQVLGRQAVLELNSAGADAAKAALSDAKDGDRDERPGLTAVEAPNLAEVSLDDSLTRIPENEGTVDDIDIESAEIPENVAPTHAIQNAEVRARSSNDQDPSEQKRSRPQRKAAASTTPKSDKEEAKKE